MRFFRVIDSASAVTAQLDDSETEAGWIGVKE
jgi:hypothetical protein